MDAELQHLVVRGGTSRLLTMRGEKKKPRLTRRGFLLVRALKHRDIFQQRYHAKDDDDHAADLLGAAALESRANE